MSLMTSDQIPRFHILSPNVPEISEASARAKHFFSQELSFRGQDRKRSEERRPERRPGLFRAWACQC